MNKNISSDLLVVSGVFGLILPLIFWSSWPSLGNALRESLLAVSAITAGIILVVLGLKEKSVVLRKPNKVTWAFLIFGLILLICFLFNNTLFNPIKNLDISSRGSEFAVFLTLFLGFVILLFYPKVKIKTALFLIYAVSWLLSLGALLALWGKGKIFWQLFLGNGNSTPALMNINQATIFAGISVISGLFLFFGLGQNKKIVIPWKKILVLTTWFLPLFLILVVGVRFVTIPLFFGVFGTFLTRSIVSKKKTSLLAVILLLFIFILAIGGPKIRLALKSLPVEVALTQKASFEITERYFSQSLKNLVFGEGRGSFPFIYEKFRTPTISQTPFWSLTFPLGASEFWTFLIEAGILGMMGLFILLGAVFWSFLNFIKKRPTEIKQENLFFPIFFGLFSFFVLLFFLYPFSLGLWIFFIFSFAFLAVALSSDKTIKWKRTTFRSAIFLISLILVFLTSLYPLKETIMEGFVAKAQSATDFTQKENYLNSAEKVFSSHPRPYLISAQTYSQVAFQILSQKESLKDEKIISFLQELLSKISQNGERAVDLEKRDPRAPLLMADIYLNLAKLGIDTEKAVELSEQYADLSIQRASQSVLPVFKKAQAKFILADKFRREGNNEKKEETVREVNLLLGETLNRSPGFLPAREMEVILADFQENYSKVIELGNNFLTDQPRNTEIRYLVAKAYWQQEQWEKAESQIQIVLNQNRAHFASLILAGKLAAREEDFPRAIDFFERARAQAPENKELPEILAALRRGENSFLFTPPATTTESAITTE
ncbi:hypothetical protein J7K42_02670 [bacterium]|nr:hypothetical protein [bacterium]